MCSCYHSPFCFRKSKVLLFASVVKLSLNSQLNVDFSVVSPYRGIPRFTPQGAITCTFRSCLEGHLGIRFGCNWI